MKKMQRMMVLLFAFVMLIVNFIYVATANSEAFTMSMNVKEETWKTVYKEALRKIHTEAREQDKEILYSLWDMDGDKVPELIIKSKYYDAVSDDYEGIVFSIRNGIVVECGSFSLFNKTAYGDVSGKGLLVYYGYMSIYEIRRYNFDDSGKLVSKLLIKGDLLKESELLDYPDITDYIPGARRLALAGTANMLLLEEYKTVNEYLNNQFPRTDAHRFPNNDTSFFQNVIEGNLPVTASWVGYSKARVGVPFQTLLEEEYLWLNDALVIKDMHYADLNGDGQMECVLDLSEKDENDTQMRFYLSEQDGTVHVYYDVYASGDMTVDKNGNLLITYHYYSFPQWELVRLVFDGNASFYQELPLVFLEQ